MNVGELCNRDVVFVRGEETVQEAARLMREHHVGCLVVVQEEGGRRPVAVLTDRDIAIGLVAVDVSRLDRLLVNDVAGGRGPLVTAGEHEDLDVVVKRMRASGIRRIPVLDPEGRLAGILALDDVMEYLAEVLGDLAALMARGRQREAEQRP